MKKIRIGNDIRLAVDFMQYIEDAYLREAEVYHPEYTEFGLIDDDEYVNTDRELYYNVNAGAGSNVNKDNDVYYTTGVEPFGTTTYIARSFGIRTIKAFLINTTRAEQVKNKPVFIARYPNEPHLNCYESTLYNVRNSGVSSWHVMPYNGFGVYPKWGNIHKKNPIEWGIEYPVPVLFTDKQNIVNIHFPAEQQRYTGVYKLIIVAKIYAPGYNSKNLKTITIDMPDVFELVKTTAEGIDTGIQMSVGLAQDFEIPIEPDIDVYVDSGLYDDGKITLTRTDGNPVDIDVSEFTDWYEGD